MSYIFSSVWKILTRCGKILTKRKKKKKNWKRTEKEQQKKKKKEKKEKKESRLTFSVFRSFGVLVTFIHFIWGIEYWVGILLVKSDKQERMFLFFSSSSSSSSSSLCCYFHTHTGRQVRFSTFGGGERRGDRTWEEWVECIAHLCMYIGTVHTQASWGETKVFFVYYLLLNNLLRYCELQTWSPQW